MYTFMYLQAKQFIFIIFTQVSLLKDNVIA